MTHGSRHHERNKEECGDPGLYFTGLPQSYSLLRNDAAIFPNYR